MKRLVREDKIMSRDYHALVRNYQALADALDRSSLIRNRKKPRTDGEGRRRPT